MFAQTYFLNKHLDIPSSRLNIWTSLAHALTFLAYITVHCVRHV